MSAEERKACSRTLPPLCQEEFPIDCSLCRDGKRYMRSDTFLSRTPRRFLAGSCLADELQSPVSEEALVGGRDNDGGPETDNVLTITEEWKDVQSTSTGGTFSKSVDKKNVTSAENARTVAEELKGKQSEKSERASSASIDNKNVTNVESDLRLAEELKDKQLTTIDVASFQSIDNKNVTNIDNDPTIEKRLYDKQSTKAEWASSESTDNKNVTKAENALSEPTKALEDKWLREIEERVSVNVENENDSYAEDATSTEFSGEQLLPNIEQASAEKKENEQIPNTENDDSKLVELSGVKQFRETEEMSEESQRSAEGESNIGNDIAQSVKHLDETLSQMQEKSFGDAVHGNIGKVFLNENEPSTAGETNFSSGGTHFLTKVDKILTKQEEFTNDKLSPTCEDVLVENTAHGDVKLSGNIIFKQTEHANEEQARPTGKMFSDSKENENSKSLENSFPEQTEHVYENQSLATEEVHVSDREEHEVRLTGNVHADKKQPPTLEEGTVEYRLFEHLPNSKTDCVVPVKCDVAPLAVQEEDLEISEQENETKSGNSLKELLEKAEEKRAQDIKEKHGIRGYDTIPSMGNSVDENQPSTPEEVSSGRNDNEDVESTDVDLPRPLDHSTKDLPSQGDGADAKTDSGHVENNLDSADNSEWTKSSTYFVGCTDRKRHNEDVSGQAMSRGVAKCSGAAPCSENDSESYDMVSCPRCDMMSNDSLSVDFSSCKSGKKFENSTKSRAAHKEAIKAGELPSANGAFHEVTAEIYTSETKEPVTLSNVTDTEYPTIKECDKSILGENTESFSCPPSGSLDKRADLESRNQSMSLFDNQTVSTKQFSVDHGGCEDSTDPVAGLDERSYPIVDFLKRIEKQELKKEPESDSTRVEISQEITSSRKELEKLSKMDSCDHSSGLGDQTTEANSSVYQSAPSNDLLGLDDELDVDDAVVTNLTQKNGACAKASSLQGTISNGVTYNQELKIKGIFRKVLGSEACLGIGETDKGLDSDHDRNKDDLKTRNVLLNDIFKSTRAKNHVTDSKTKVQETALKFGKVDDSSSPERKSSSDQCEERQPLAGALLQKFSNRTVESSCMPKCKRKWHLSANIKRVQDQLQKEVEENRPKTKRDSSNNKCSSHKVLQNVQKELTKASDVVLLPSSRAISRAQSRSKSRSRTSKSRGIAKRAPTPSRKERPYRQWLGVSKCVSGDSRFIIHNKDCQEIDPASISDAKMDASELEAVAEEESVSLGLQGLSISLGKDNSVPTGRTGDRTVQNKRGKSKALSYNDSSFRHQIRSPDDGNEAVRKADNLTRNASDSKGYQDLSKWFLSNKEHDRSNNTEYSKTTNSLTTLQREASVEPPVDRESKSVPFVSEMDSDFIYDREQRITKLSWSEMNHSEKLSKKLSKITPVMPNKDPFVPLAEMSYFGGNGSNVYASFKKEYFENNEVRRFSTADQFNNKYLKPKEKYIMAPTAVFEHPLSICGGPTRRTEEVGRECLFVETSNIQEKGASKTSRHKKRKPIVEGCIEDRMDSFSLDTTELIQSLLADKVPSSDLEKCPAIGTVIVSGPIYPETYNNPRGEYSERSMKGYKCSNDEMSISPNSQPSVNSSWLCSMQCSLQRTHDSCGYKSSTASSHYSQYSTETVISHKPPHTPMKHRERSSTQSTRKVRAKRGLRIVATPECGYAGSAWAAKSVYCRETTDKVRHSGQIHEVSAGISVWKAPPDALSSGTYGSLRGRTSIAASGSFRDKLLLTDDAASGKQKSSQKYILVQAVKDYEGKLPGQLSFQKGQLIKQRSETSDSLDLCYGYYRAGRFRVRKSGLFPASHVVPVG